MPGKYVWSRFWAKYIDLAIFAIVWSVPANSFAADAYTAQAAENTWTMFFWLGLLVYPFWETLFVAASGTSFGRLPFGLRVIDPSTKAKPEFGKALKRTWRCWIWGCGFGIPILSWITMLSSKAYLDTEAVSSWDEIAGTQVVRGAPLRQS